MTFYYSCTGYEGLRIRGDADDVRKQKTYQVVGNFALAVTALLACACVHYDFKIVFQARARNVQMIAKPLDRVADPQE